ncbi:MAG: UDP-N-acetylmuramate dehydrogenase, partial [Gammaproteobacteria bacterium]
MKIRQNVPLAPYTTLGIGGPARYFIEARDEPTALAGLAFGRHRGLPIFVLGGGSNILVADSGFPGLVLRVAIKGILEQDAADKTVFTLGAGEDWDAFVCQAVQRGLGGIECLSGIPGTVGGTPVQNVGAYGQEVSETLVSVRAYDQTKNTVVELSKSECGFSYRQSIFNTTARDRYVALTVTYALQKNARPELRYTDVQK